MVQMNLQIRRRLTHSESSLMAARGGGRIGGRDGEFGIDMHTLLCLKWITNKDLLFST